MTQLNWLAHRLCAADIDGVIVGEFAGMLHGSSLVTRDLDLCAELTRENLAKLRAALSDLNPIHRQTAERPSFL